ncbi:hypothetical protein I546_1724 [Mycobacterium kansasii 732]|uniref:Uncharacterized protein n=1 Tax=Mycobacterium kansasii TaxID=1768 RepID=A0A164CJW7_MYCKA|nr:hypothetical protein [Mycobacterium pseudokansasii]EUA12811.1 hypothetical protein I546_1724 [Mycobacterium kansasii 732]KZS64813.1 hypothetical protein A4G27_04895 [Mycobacterium kansasii]MBY0387910.1 hypothetical protein [Mycobacterium pseudokansasii]OOK79191.1 hypothetical protein BZL30_1761 [Mycobacterium kansasii]VAZ98259.1 hypothetical protein LAUMK35_03954 [Mycobacterium pseudokansasii]
MPGDLLRYLGGPTGYSGWWWLVAGACAGVVICYYAGVYVWTLPAARLRRVPVIRSVHSYLLRRRFARTITTIGGQYGAGQLSDGQAAAAISRALRGFLCLSTGARVQYMHIDDIAKHGQLASATPVFAALNDARFATESIDMHGVIRAATEVIRTWS